eukprot:6458025-Amphidinium_carterae.1
MELHLGAHLMARRAQAMRITITLSEPHPHGCTTSKRFSQQARESIRKLCWAQKLHGRAAIRVCAAKERVNLESDTWKRA